MSPIRSWRRPSLALAVSALCLSAPGFAAEDANVAAAIRGNLAKRLPNLPPIDEVTRSPVPGLWELRLGAHVIYSDAQGSFVIEGEILDTSKNINLTRQRIEDLTAFDFAKLPLKDAVVWKQGNGARKLVVFADPNCGYCKKLERDLGSIPNLTVYTFLVPILGGDSPQKSRDIWCAKDRSKAWRDWMIANAPPPSATPPCDTAALTRNVLLGEKHGVTGTPSLVFENNERVAGIIGNEALEKKLALLARVRHQ